MNPESISPLSFGVLLVHPPLLHSDKKLRELFNKLGTIHEFTEYQQLTEGAAQFRRTWRATNERISCTFRNDRVEIVHDFPTTDLQGFWRTVQDVLSESVKMLRIPAFVLQQYLIRKVANPLAVADARIFLTQKVCSIQDEQLQEFGRPLHGIGLRLFFPASQEAPAEYDVKVESLLRDPMQLFLENRAKFYVPVQTADLTPMKSNLEATEQFLTETVVRFLYQFN